MSASAITTSARKFSSQRNLRFAAKNSRPNGVVTVWSAIHLDSKPRAGGAGHAETIKFKPPQQVIELATSYHRNSHRKIKPFGVRREFTALHNALLDFIMPQLSGSEWKVLCYIIRHTSGWAEGDQRRVSDQISYSQIARGKATKDGRQLDAGTGIKSAATISEALKALVKAGYIFKSPGEKWEAMTYTLNLDFEIETGIEDAAPTSKIEVEATSKIEPPPLQKMKQEDAAPTSKIEDTKETGPNKEIERNTHTLRVVAGASAGEPQCVGMSKSRFPLKTCIAWAEWRAQQPGAEIRDASAVGQARYRDGTADELINDWLSRTPEQVAEARAHPVEQGKGYPEALQLIGSIDNKHGRASARAEIGTLQVSDDTRMRLFDKFPPRPEAVTA